MTGGRPFLFSVDLEDPRLQLADGGRYGDRVPAMTERFLDYLRPSGGKATFFVVGNVARRYSGLVRRIAAEGHEIACHSDSHVPLERMDPASFRDDLLRNLEALDQAGALRPRGYRAPCFSLTERTRWAYPVLAELGFSYSSSVLPARNPLYGWPRFGGEPRLMEGIVELPMTLLSRRLLPLPAGGVYFRALPWALVRRALRASEQRRQPLMSYFHPYDIDEEQERFAYPGFSRFGLSNWLMYRNRGSVFARIDVAKGCGGRFEAYGEYAEAALRRLGGGMRVG